MVRGNFRREILVGDFSKLPRSKQLLHIFLGTISELRLANFFRRKKNSKFGGKVSGN